MGARAKRRLAIAATALVVAGAVAVFPTTRSGSPTRQTPKEVYGTFGAFGITYGINGKQLLARLGPPDRKRNSCWLYRIRGGTFNGIKLIPQIAGMDAVRYCFFSGVLALIQDHWRPGMHMDPLPQAWTPPIEYGCGGRPCRPATT